MVTRLLRLVFALLYAVSTVGAVPSRVFAQDILVVVYAPLPGQAVQGQVPIDIGVAAPGYARIEVLFAYAHSTPKTWFLISETDEIPFDGVLANWDTAAISDGEYDLRLVVLTDQGEAIVYDVPGLRVRNYSPVESSTPTAPVPTMTQLPGQVTPEPSPTATARPPTHTPFPTNPAIFTERQLAEGASLGGMVTLVVFTLFFVYLVASSYLRNRE